MAQFNTDGLRHRLPLVPMDQSMVPAIGWRDRYFLPMTTGVIKVASHMIDGTNHKTIGW